MHENIEFCYGWLGTTVCTLIALCVLLRFIHSHAAGSTIVPSQQQVSIAQQLKPQILEHPQSQQVEAGDPLTLRCSAMGGAGQLSYTWYFNGLSLAGEDRPEYEINCFTDEDEGLYQCKVQSAHGEVLSRMAHIQMKDDGSD